MTKDKALKIALGALEDAWYEDYGNKELNKAITAIKKALAQPEPKRKWVGLTDDEQRDIAYSDINCWDWGELMDAVEAKLKEKNT